MTEPLTIDPAVDVDGVRDVARDLLVVPNRGAELVPNIGIIGGTEAVLVVDTGMGTENAAAVLTLAERHAAGRRLYLTTTHFHPEHAFGAATFAGRATYLVNRAQATDLAERTDGYLAMFRRLGPGIARRLEGVTTPVPDEVHGGERVLDLGRRTVHLRPTGRAHSRGDQVVVVPDVGVLFTGDLVETGQFAIFPWFPPHDTDVTGVGWIAVLERLIADRPAIVVPGHGEIGDSGRLVDVHDYLLALRDETWRRRDSGMSEETIAEEVRDALLSRHPDWAGQEWIAPGIACLCAEHDSRSGT